MGFYCPPQSSCSLSGHQSLWECPEDPSRGRHLGPILSLLATGQGALDSPAHAFLQLPASESEWSGAGAGNGKGHYMGAEEDGRSRRPLPWALPGISTVLAPRFFQWEPPDEWLICPETVGMNLSVGAGEQEGLSPAEHGMNESWTLPVPGEHPECFLSQVRGDWPRFQGELREGCSACPHPVSDSYFLSRSCPEHRRKECVDRPNEWC